MFFLLILIGGLLLMLGTHFDAWWSWLLLGSGAILLGIVGGFAQGASRQ